jgi:hypothetical protein
VDFILRDNFADLISAMNKLVGAPQPNRPQIKAAPTRRLTRQ